MILRLVLMRPSGLWLMSLKFRMLRFLGEGEDLGSSFLLVIVTLFIHPSFFLLLEVKETTARRYMDARQLCLYRTGGIAQAVK
jgi:hypothetical protein